MSPEQLQKAGPRPKLFQVMKEKEEPRDRGEISQTLKSLKFAFVILYTYIVSIFCATLLWQILTPRIRDSCCHCTVAWVTRPGHPKGAKDEVKQARWAQSR